MAAIRENILISATARDKYIRGVKLLKNEFPGPTTSSLGIAAPPAQSALMICLWSGIMWR